MSAILALAIIIPLDTTPFKMHEKEVVRLMGQGISGSKIEAKIQGPAKIEMEGAVRHMKNGHPLIGSMSTEFLIKPTGKGKVKVEIIVKPPQPNTPPHITKYEFEVE